MPELHLLTSNAQTVIFEITISGIYRLDTVVNGIAFSRLNLSGGGAVNPAGSPEIPVLSYRVAIPECSGTAVTYSIESRQTLNSCWVYPVPEIVLNQNGTPIEQFAFNPAAYAQPRSSDPIAVITSNGALRAQRYVEVMVQPVEFCPVTRALSVIDKVIVTLSFNNPQGDLRQNVGIFNKVATNAFINYEDDGQSASNRNDTLTSSPQAPFMRYINLTDTAQACKITADYLIICADTFYKPKDPNSQLTRLARHRVKYNGFDVAIVNVEQTLGLNFYYEGNPNDPNPMNWDKYKKEQKIRTFIRRVYEGKNARHMEDSCLAYVLLVGDNYEYNTVCWSPE